MIIIPNKIATRKWCKDTFGSASLVYYNDSTRLNECIRASDLNSATTTGKITLPNSNDNGALPPSYLSNGQKCYTQEDIFKLYQIIPINPLLSIVKVVTSSGNVSITRYKIVVNITYYNEVKTTTTYPTIGGFVAGTGVSFNVYVKRHSKSLTNLGAVIASTSLSGMTLPYPSTTYSSSTVDKDVFSSIYLISTISEPTGSVTYDKFFTAYLEDMYKYFKGETSNATYTVSASINTVAYIKENSILKPTYFELNQIGVVTSTSTSETTNNAKANISYNCNTISTDSSGNTIWGFTVKVSNKQPNQTSQSLVSISVDKGSVSIATNSGTTTQTITGAITYKLTGISDLPPFVTIKFSPSGYVPFSYTSIANLQADLDI